MTFFLADPFPATLKNTHSNSLSLSEIVSHQHSHKYPKRKTYQYSLINYMCVIRARQMWEGTHTCCGQKIKLGPLYIIRYFNGRRKWEIWSICLVSLKDQEETTMSLLHAVWIKKLGKRQWRGHMETWWRRGGPYERCHHQNADILWRSQGCHITHWEILPSPVRRNKLLLWDFAVVTRDCDSQRAVSVLHTHSCIFLLALSGGLVQHCECRRPCPRGVWQHVRPQQLKARSEGPQAGARRVRRE